MDSQTAVYLPANYMIRQTICTKGTFGFFTMITSYHTPPLYFARTILLN
jgi:hypothetical protein